MLRSLKLGESTREFIILFTFVEFGNFNNKNVKKKRFVRLIFKKNKKRVRFIFGFRETYVTVMNNAIAGRGVTESWLGTGIFKAAGSGLLPCLWLEPACIVPSLVAPNGRILHGPHDTFTAVSFR